jgi:deoxyribodipyrimidine photo-lyase
MHNRVRMIVASFLTKDLLIDWRAGERWFWDTLVDADPANNAMGWQWVTGSGADAAPYFRVFNPVLQGEKFDPRGDYVRRWIPELGGFSPEQVHRPWTADRPLPPQVYPARIIEHAPARERALLAFRSLKPSA